MNKEVENEKGFIDRDEETVSRLIGDLKRVDAPANFERRVMSRIAEGETKSGLPFSLPTLALATCAIVVLLVGSIVFYNMRRPVVHENEVAQAPVAQIPQSTVQIQQPIIPQPTANQETVAENGGGPFHQTPAQNRRIPKQVRPETNSNNSGGSITLGQGQIQPIYPQGIRPNATRSNVNTSEIISQNAIPVQDILGMTGVSAEFKNEWIVKAVAKNSIAERSGIRSGDAITAINDKQLTADTNFHGSGSIISLTVRRDGQALTLKLK